MIPADSRCSQLIACERQTQSIVLGFSAAIYLTALGMDCQFLRFITGEMCRKIFNPCSWLNPRGPWTGLMLTEQESRIKSRLLICKCVEGFLHTPLTDSKLKCKMSYTGLQQQAPDCNWLYVDFALTSLVSCKYWFGCERKSCWLLANRNVFCTNFENM